MSRGRLSEPRTGRRVSLHSTGTSSLERQALGPLDRFTRTPHVLAAKAAACFSVNFKPVFQKLEDKKYLTTAQDLWNY